MWNREFPLENRRLIFTRIILLSVGLSTEGYNRSNMIDTTLLLNIIEQIIYLYCLENWGDIIYGLI